MRSKSKRRVSKRRVSKSRVSKRRVSKRRVSKSRRRVYKSRRRVSKSRRRVSKSRRRVSKSRRRVSKSRRRRRMCSSERVRKYVVPVMRGGSLADLVDLPDLIERLETELLPDLNTSPPTPESIKEFNNKYTTLLTEYPHVGPHMADWLHTETQWRFIQIQLIFLLDNLTLPNIELFVRHPIWNSMNAVDGQAVAVEVMSARQEDVIHQLNLLLTEKDDTIELFVQHPIWKILDAEGTTGAYLNDVAVQADIKLQLNALLTVLTLDNIELFEKHPIWKLDINNDFAEEYLNDVTIPQHIAGQLNALLTELTLDNIELFEKHPIWKLDINNGFAKLYWANVWEGCLGKLNELLFFSDPTVENIELFEKHPIWTGYSAPGGKQFATVYWGWMDQNQWLALADILDAIMGAAEVGGDGMDIYLRHPIWKSPIHHNFGIHFWWGGDGAWAAWGDGRAPVVMRDIAGGGAEYLILYQSVLCLISKYSV